MLTYSFQNLGSDSLYEHLYKCIKQDILEGKLTPGSKLPSKRTFAKNLGISTITIENAYGQLIAEGYLYSIPKKGFFVSDINGYQSHKPLITNENINLTSGESTYFADFTSNQTRAEIFPFATWAKLMREVMSEHETALLTNPPCGGIFLLRQAIAQHLKDFRGLDISPEQIIVGAGTEYLYGLLIQLLGYDKIYGVENPGYLKIHKIYQSNRVKSVPIELDKSGMDLVSLNQSGADIIHLSPSHHFPTGIVTPISRRYELLGWASQEENRYIIEDDYDSEFRLNGKPIPTLKSIDVMNKVIYMNTFTKSLASTIRISYMVLPAHLANHFYQEMNFYSCTVSNFEQYTLARFITEGYFEKHINRMRNYYHIQRDLLLEAIKKSPLSSHITIMEKDSGLHFLMQIHTTIAEDDFIQLALQQGIKLSSLSQYYLGDYQGTNNVYLINYSYLEPSHIEQAINRLYHLKGGSVHE